MVFKKGDVILNEIDPFENIYFVQKGEVMLCKKIALNKKSKFFEKIDDSKTEKMIKALNGSDLPISICNKSELIGYEGLLEMSFGQNYYTHICVSPKAVLYSISVDVLLKLFPKIGENIFKSQNQQIESRLSRFSTSIEQFIKISSDFLSTELSLHFNVEDENISSIKLQKFLNSTILHRLKEINHKIEFINKKNDILLKKRENEQENIDPFDTISFQHFRKLEGNIFLKKSPKTGLSTKCFFKNLSQSQSQKFKTRGMVIQSCLLKENKEMIERLPPI